MKNIISILLLGAAASLVGCVTTATKETFLPDGRKAYIANCSSERATMGACLDAAAQICKGDGYQIIYHKNDAVGYSSSSYGVANYNANGAAYGAASPGAAFISGMASAMGSASSSSYGSTTYERDLMFVCGAAKDKDGKPINPAQYLEQVKKTSELDKQKKKNTENENVLSPGMAAKPSNSLNYGSGSGPAKKEDIKHLNLNQQYEEFKRNR